MENNSNQNISVSQQSSQAIPMSESAPTENAQIVKNTPQPAAKESRKWIVIEIILLIFLVISISSYFIPEFGQKAYEGKLKSESPEVNITNTKMSTSGWKSFEGKAVGISFKYPSNWFEEDSTWISEKKPKPPATNTNVMDLSDDNRGLIINLIQVEKDDNLEQFNRIKSYKLKEVQVESDEFDSQSVTKIMEGKLNSGEEYIVYFYANNYTDGYDEEEIGPKEDPAITLAVKGKNNTIYRLTLSNYDENGKNVLASIISTIAISDKPLEWKKYNNGTFSFSYPPDAKLSASGLGFSGQKIYITHGNGDFSDPEIIIKGNKYDDAANNLDEWDYWYIDWDNFLKDSKDNPNISIPESELVNGHRIIKGPGVDYMDGQYVDYGTKYFIFRGGYVIEVLGQTGSEDLTEKILKSIVIDPTVAGETPDLSEF